ncbi:helix-turn-helix domain-containing protein [Rhizobium sp. 0TCS1.26]|uniref:LexA family protein n=1 Tax=Rhizobium sp. 0TCS1.26 TaxID=3142623 RepID=UPI003D2B61F0
MTTWWKRLDERIAELGWNDKELARQSGIPYANINKYLNGKIEQPRGDVLDRLARSVKKHPLWLREGIDPQDLEAVPSTSGFTPVTVVGTVEAGTFREVDDFDQSEPEVMSLPPDDRFPHARLMAFNVSGDSMNDLRPRPILPGDRVVCVAYEDVAREAILRDGMVVVVERSRDGGLTREWSVKQIEIYEDRTEFHPRSHNPRHKPIVIERDMEADNGISVQILGLVRRVVNDLPY